MGTENENNVRYSNFDVDCCSIFQSQFMQRHKYRKQFPSSIIWYSIRQLQASMEEKSKRRQQMKNMMTPRQRAFVTGEKSVNGIKTEYIDLEWSNKTLEARTIETKSPKKRWRTREKRREREKENNLWDYRLGIGRIEYVRIRYLMVALFDIFVIWNFAPYLLAMCVCVCFAYAKNKIFTKTIRWNAWPGYTTLSDCCLIWKHTECASILVSIRKICHL